MNEIDIKEAERRLHLLLDPATSLEQMGWFNSQLGLELVSLDPGEGKESHPCIEYRYRAKDEHRNAFGHLHGGMICSVLDTAMGCGCASFTGEIVNTANIEISYLRQAAGKNYRIRIKYPHIGSRIINTVGELYDEDNDELCATGAAIFMLLGVKRWE